MLAVQGSSRAPPSSRARAFARGFRASTPPARRVHCSCDNQKKLTREAEPEEAWNSKYEKPGANPLQDPLAIIGLFAILFPFLLLLVFIATGVIDVNK